jgi:hypothetical protein
MRLKSDKTGDAPGQPSWRVSLLGDPGAKFFCQSWGQAQNRRNQQEWEHPKLRSGMKSHGPVLNRPRMAGFRHPEKRERFSCTSPERKVQFQEKKKLNFKRESIINMLAPFSRALVGLHHQSLLGRGSRHCHGIKFTQNPMVGAKPAKTKIPAVNMLTTRQHVVHLGRLRNSFTASTSLV